MLLRRAACSTLSQPALSVGVGRGGASTCLLELPVFRLPTAIFPQQPVSLPVITQNPHDRPIAGCLSPALADELRIDCRVAEELTRGRRRDLPQMSGHVALLAAGASVGVVAELPTASSASIDGMLLHVLGGTRVSLVRTLHRSPAGARYARFVPCDDAPLPAFATATRALELEAEAARSLLARFDMQPSASAHSWLSEAAAGDAQRRSPLPGASPSSHPRWREFARVPESPAALPFWLAARLPLPEDQRRRLLGCDCPLERLRLVVDAMRAMVDKPPGAGEGR